MNVPVRPSGEPSLHFGVFVRTVVIHDQVNIHLRRDVRFNAAQKCEELLVAVARLAIGQYGAVLNIQSGKQGRRAMA